MTFEMVSGGGVVACDTCPDVIETGMDNFKDTMIESRKRGWRSYKGPDDEWAHACPSCTENYAKSRGR